MSVHVNTLKFHSLTKTAAMLLLMLMPLAARASDMPQAAGSPSAGITFDDRPLMLPIQRNFQMAMLTASSELGRSCGQMEAYGWRMGANEQQRVNQIFNNTVDRMRAQGFAVESKSPSSVSRDVTMFTADRPDKHLLFMWSAGEIGLVMVLCETSAPIAPTPQAAAAGTLGTLGGTPAPAPGGALSSGGKGAPLTITRAGKRVVENFSPLGDWVGTYTCAQGTTGGTLQVTKLRGDQFEGIFRFYPTPKNPYVPSGRYTVYGEYDRDSQRILINPGKWLARPPNYQNTIMIGSFDAVAKTFSGYFQGINGCTSFEAKYSANSSEIESKMTATAAKSAKKTAKPVAKKTTVKKKKASKPAAAKAKKAPVVTEPAPETTDSSADETPGIRLGDHIPAPAKPAKTETAPAAAPQTDAAKPPAAEKPAEPTAPAKTETAPQTATPSSEPVPLLDLLKPKTGK